MKDYVYYGNLLDIYQTLLNDNNKIIFKLYYEENLTFQEIADNLNVSKSYIGKIIKNTQKKLDDYERKLNVYKNKEILKELLKIDDIKIIKKKLVDLIES